MEEIPEDKRESRFSKRETDVLTALRLGCRVSRDDVRGLLEECDGCGGVFMSSALRVHIKECRSSI
ncbi:hypothetical protein BDN67DRAFT_976561 [Paxillus ammoniavirescens]|nr:hypothetical protein BDN67DRAFT_976561 [Paxillus ammoniavirescens]